MECVGRAKAYLRKEARLLDFGRGPMNPSRSPRASPRGSCIAPPSGAALEGVHGDTPAAPRGAIVSRGIAPGVAHAALVNARLPRTPRGHWRLGRLPVLVLLLAAGPVVLTGGCASRDRVTVSTDSATVPPFLGAARRRETRDSTQLATSEALAQFEGHPTNLYRLGPGDKIRSTCGDA